MVQISHPEILWAQRADKLFVTINISDAKVETLDLKEQSISFKATSHNVEYAFELEFFAKIKPEDCKKALSQRSIFLEIPKLDESAPWWPRLSSSKVRLNFVKTDFDRWRDEDESEEEKEEAANPMMPNGLDFSQFGNMPDFAIKLLFNNEFKAEECEDHSNAIIF
ncbi:hypothetical protein BB560_003403 [Smittium megazygosporum]|uniref:CS domain-containing protein n=1 Tax=Smittium megazygosporum TaxID=133381 RepID=A0A2T9ZC70_9FUNG|nr:hypothetical protein BB560_003403 [Smittium megazygosporum]